MEILPEIQKIDKKEYNLLWTKRELEVEGLRVQRIFMNNGIWKVILFTDDEIYWEQYQDMMDNTYSEGWVDFTGQLQTWKYESPYNIEPENFIPPDFEDFQSWEIKRDTNAKELKEYYDSKHTQERKDTVLSITTLSGDNMEIPNWHQYEDLGEYLKINYPEIQDIQEQKFQIILFHCHPKPLDMTHLLPWKRKLLLESKIKLEAELYFLNEEGNTA